MRFDSEGMPHVLGKANLGDERRPILISQIFPIHNVEIPTLELVVIWIVEIKQDGMRPMWAAMVDRLLTIEPIEEDGIVPGTKGTSIAVDSVTTAGQILQVLHKAQYGAISLASHWITSSRYVAVL